MGLPIRTSNSFEGIVRTIFFTIVRNDIILNIFIGDVKMNVLVMKFQ